MRIDNKLSEWYVMQRGIHQGGFLSLMKYTSFMDSLLVQLEQSHSCCGISHIPSNTAGYADDLGAAIVLNSCIDAVHQIVFEYGRKTIRSHLMQSSPLFRFMVRARRVTESSN